MVLFIVLSCGLIIWFVPGPEGPVYTDGPPLRGFGNWDVDRVVYHRPSFLPSLAPKGVLSV